jgi:ZIP family zinc transporter
VICQLLGLAAWAKQPKVLTYGPSIGLFAGFLTDAIITAARVPLTGRRGGIARSRR